MKQSWKKLEEYLLNISPKEVLCWENNKSYVDMSWIFTKPLDKKIIQKALANIMQNQNPTYTSKCERRGMKPEDIPGFYVIKNKDRILLGAPGNDGWTKVNLTDRLVDEDNKDGKIPVMTFDDLIKEVQNVITENKEVTEQEADFLIMGIKSAFSQSFENFVDYYQYLLNEKQEAQKHKCTIQPRQDVGGKKRRAGLPPTERKSPIIEFTERDRFLNGKNPELLVEVQEMLKDGTIIPNSYTVYVYRDLLKEIQQEQEGYLFVCEPLNGDRTTRLMFVSDEEFKNIVPDEAGDRFEKTVKKYLDMSDEEFYHQKGTANIMHTDFETYKERIEFFKEGKKGSSLQNLKAYKVYMEKLYDKSIDIPYYKPRTKKDIATLGGDTNFSEIDRTAQSQITKGDKNEVIEW